MFKKLAAEFAGTFFLVLCGTGAIVINNESHGAITHLGIAVSFGLIVCIMIYAFGNISGAHLNPAVTLALFTSGKFPLKGVPLYILAQTAGAFAATVKLKWFFPNDQFLGATLPYNNSWKMAFGMEFILTFLLMLVILRVISQGKELANFAGIIIGAVILLEALFAGPVCGASMNPVRSLAPAIVSGHTEHLWAYLTAPVLGALIATVVHAFFFETKTSAQ